jgi:altronate dehydratase small subunit
VKAALVISERDNVATALERLLRGRALDVDGAIVVAAQDIPPGHKLALRRIAAGEPVIKYGSPIGIATVDIGPGEHVHTHNVASSRGRGDLDVPAAAGLQRLAEPPDDPSLRPNGPRADASGQLETSAGGSSPASRVTRIGGSEPPQKASS